MTDGTQGFTVFAIYQGNGVLRTLRQLQDSALQSYGLARTGRPGYQDQPALLQGDLLENLGQQQLLDGVDLEGNHPEDYPDGAALLEHVDAEARHGGDLERAGRPGDVDTLLGHAVRRQRLDCAVQQPRGNRLVEPRRHNGETALDGNRVSLKCIGHIRLRRSKQEHAGPAGLGESVVRGALEQIQLGSDCSRGG